MKAPGSFLDLDAHRGVFEVKYPRAHKYWDVSGAVVARVERELPGLSCQALGDLGFRFSPFAPLGVAMAAFYWDRVLLEPNLETDQTVFQETCGRFWTIVRESFEVEKVSRLGNRYAYRFAGNEKPDQHLKRLGLWRAESSMVPFGDPMNEDLVLRFENEAIDRRIRLELGTSTRAERGTERGVVIMDIDFTPIKPVSPDFDAVDFMGVNLSFLKTNLHQILR